MVVKAWQGAPGNYVKESPVSHCYTGGLELALAGDMGGTLGPSLVGVGTQAGNNNIQSGLLAASVFPVILVICLICIRRVRKSKE